MSMSFVANGNFVQPSGTSATFTLTMGAGERVVVPIITATQGSAITVSISGGGLTWKRRGVALANTTGGDFQSTDWFYADSVAGITSQTITVTTSGAMGGMVGSWIRALNGGQPIYWDENASFPATAQTSGTAGTPAVTVSTSDPNTMILAVGGRGVGLLSMACTPSNIGSHSFMNGSEASGASTLSGAGWYGLYTGSVSGLVVTETASATGLNWVVDALSGGPGGNFWAAA